MSTSGGGQSSSRWLLIAALAGFLIAAASGAFFGTYWGRVTVAATGRKASYTACVASASDGRLLGSSSKRS